MNPNVVFSATLVTSLVLWSPSMQACLRGDLDLAPAGLRYLAAFAVSRLAMGALAGLVAAYRATQHHDSAEAEADAGSPGSAPAPPVTASHTTPDPVSPQRRRGDRSAGDDTDPDTLAA